ncbi:large subunit ribosomal protein L27e [Nematocida sp. AWRm80]|nr:large subunit ribosomal protein L27e [Nematocida sp. AWRm80]
MFRKEQAVVITKGRYAGQKAIIVEEMNVVDKRTVITVVGMEKTPKPITEDMTDKQKARRSEIKCFIKRMNIRHVLATGYSLENALDKLEIKDITATSDKIAMKKEAEKIFKRVYTVNPTHWVFQKQKI